MAVRFRIVAVNLIILLVLIKGVDTYLGWGEATTKPRSERVIALRENLPLIADSVEASDKYMAKTEHLQQRPFMLRTDSNGFIIGHPDQVFDTARLDIIFFGGSTTECRFMNEEVRFPFRVGKLLQYNNHSLRTRNAGFSGNHSVNSTLSLIAKGIDQRPRIVVMMHAINDMVILTMTGSYHKTPASRTLIKQMRIGSERLSKRPIKERILYSIEGMLSVPFPHITAHLSNPFKPTVVVDEWAHHRARQGNVQMDKMLMLFEQSLRTFVGVARANDIDPVLMTQPNRMLSTEAFVRNFAYPQDSGMPYDTACKYFALFNDCVREVAITEGVVLIELQKKIPASSTYFYDGVHLTEEGSLMVADTIAAQLRLFFPDMRPMR